MLMKNLEQTDFEKGQQRYLSCLNLWFIFFHGI